MLVMKERSTGKKLWTDSRSTYSTICTRKSWRFQRSWLTGRGVEKRKMMGEVQCPEPLSFPRQLLRQAV